MGELTEQLAKRTGITAADATKVIRALVSLHSIRRSLDVDHHELMRLLSETLKRSGPPSWWSAWEKAQPEIAILLAKNHPLATFEKAGHLAYQYQNVVTRLQIITDVRPVFSADVSRIERGILAFVLRVEYHDGAHLHAIDLALDASDVSELSQLCERAETKARIAREQLSGSFPIGVAGEVEE